jgi:hypothetical protein
VIVSRGQGIACQRGKIGGHGRVVLTRVRQHEDYRLHAANMWFRELEQLANVASGTMDCTDPCREDDLLALSRRAFVDVCDMVWAVSAMEIDDLSHS